MTETWERSLLMLGVVGSKTGGGGGHEKLRKLRKLEGDY